MRDYQKKADMLKTWTVREVKMHPELVVGQLRSAAATIERLGSEVENMNRENFWLTWQRPAAGAQSVEIPPVVKGDRVWCIGNRGGNAYLRRGKVDRVEIVDGRAAIYIHGVGMGEYGKRVFCTHEEAEAALKGGGGA